MCPPLSFVFFNSFSFFKIDRFNSVEEYDAVAGSYCVDAALMMKAKQKMIVMHPLPRCVSYSLYCSFGYCMMSFEILCYINWNILNISYVFFLFFYFLNFLFFVFCFNFHFNIHKTFILFFYLNFIHYYFDLDLERFTQKWTRTPGQLILGTKKIEQNFSVFFWNSVFLKFSVSGFDASLILFTTISQ